MIVVLFMGLNESQVSELRFEIISEKARLKFTRLIRNFTNRSGDADINMIFQNRYINIARNVLGLPIYILEADELGCYLPVEHAWHMGEIEVLMRRPDTVQLIEILADYIQNELLDVSDVNEFLNEDGVAVYFECEDEAKVHIVSLEEIEDAVSTDEHPNIRLLVQRMENAFESEDYPQVLHASASIFETLAKDVVGIDNIKNKSLGSFFDRYRKDSLLPDEILDYIYDIFQRRGEEPLAGHGHTEVPTINREKAAVLIEMTKSFVRIERRLASPTKEKESIAKAK